MKKAVTVPAATGRNQSLDFFKGIVTVIMICGHIVQFFPLNWATAIFSDYVNLTTFSCFALSLGYASDIAYISRNREKRVLRAKLAGNAVKTLLAYYISGIAYSALIEGDMSWQCVTRILLFQKVPGYSEFLLTFAAFYPVLYFLRPLLTNLDGRLYLSYLLISLLATFLPYWKVQGTLTGVLIGSSTFSCFPLLQYAGYFVTGVYLSQKKLVFHGKLFTATCVAGAAFLYYVVCFRSLPVRFPPSLFWVLGGYFATYVYYLLSCKTIERFSNGLTAFVCSIGRKTLSYLLISNLLLFTARKLVDVCRPYLPAHRLLMVYIILMAACIGIPYCYNVAAGKIRYRAEPENR